MGYRDCIPGLKYGVDSMLEFYNLKGPHLLKFVCGTSPEPLCWEMKICRRVGASFDYPCLVAWDRVVSDSFLEAKVALVCMDF